MIELKRLVKGVVSSAEHRLKIIDSIFTLPGADFDSFYLSVQAPLFQEQHQSQILANRLVFDLLEFGIE